MYAVETVFLLLMTAWLIVTNTKRATRGASVKLFVACTAAIALAFAVGEARLQWSRRRSSSSFSRCSC